MSKDYSRFIDEDTAYAEMEAVLEKALGRELTELEQRKIYWLAGCEFDTVGVIVDLFRELASKKL